MTYEGANPFITSNNNQTALNIVQQLKETKRFWGSVINAEELFKKAEKDWIAKHAQR